MVAAWFEGLERARRDSFGISEWHGVRHRTAAFAVLTWETFSCFTPTSCSCCRANKNCNTVARPCKNKWKTFNKKSWSLVFIWICEEMFLVSLQWTQSRGVWFLIVATYWRHLRDQLLLVLSWTIVNHCAGNPFLPCSSPNPPHLPLSFGGGWGDGYISVWVDVLIAVREKKCISDTFHTWAIFLHSMSC